MIPTHHTKQGFGRVLKAGIPVFIYEEKKDGVIVKDDAGNLWAGKREDLKQVPTRFHHYTNEDLIRRINSAPDFGWDDEGDELGRRMEAGTIRAEMRGNKIVII